MASLLAPARPGRVPAQRARPPRASLPMHPRAPGASWPVPFAGADPDRATRIQLFEDVNRTAGNSAAGTLARTLGGIQRAPDDAPAPPADAKPAGYALTNSRFTPHARLQDIANGGEPLSKKDRAPAVKAAQTALLDIGYSLLRYKDDGSFGGETALAISQFRADNGVTEGEGLNAATMKTLDKAAPPPGQITEHYLDYERLFADGKLDVVLSIGYDEEQTHYADLKEAREWLAAHKLTKQGAPEPKQEPVAEGEEAPPKPDPDAETRKGISVPETYTGRRSVTYPLKDGSRTTKEIAITITLVPPGTGGKAAFAKGLNDAELSLYSGHARRGIGPDFDKDKSPYENFIIGVNSALHKAGRVVDAGAVAKSHYVLGKKNDLEEMKDTWDPEKYRVWFFSACSSIAYMDELRGGLLPEKLDRHSLDLFGTTQETPIAAGLAPVWENLNGILAGATMEEIVRNMQTATFEALRKKVEAADVSEAKKKAVLREFSGQMFMREGAGDNPVAASP
jgi:peptidoglycan hydrolase-like protein with peptidoglycan-binding domain